MQSNNQPMIISWLKSIVQSHMDQHEAKTSVILNQLPEISSPKLVTS
jgi:hypothetical protein